jgi:hypothetical protein
MIKEPRHDGRLLWLCLAFFGIAAQLQAVPPRTTAIRLRNDTSETLYLVKTGMVHGDWTPELHPPAEIKPGTEGYWKSESNALGTAGPQGNIRYRMGMIAWVAPFDVTPNKSAPSKTSVASVSRNPDQVDIFWIAADGSISSAWWNVTAKKWSAPFVLVPASAARAGSPLVALSRLRDHMDLFWISPDGGIHSVAFSGKKWLKPFNVTPAGVAHAKSTLAAVARDGNHIDLFWMGNNNAIETAWWAEAANKGNWNPHFAITPAKDARADGALTASARTADELHVFYANHDDGVSSLFWTRATGKWAAPYHVSGKSTVGAGSNLAALSREAKQLDVFWVSPAGAVSHTWANKKLDGNKWHDPAAISGPKAVRLHSPLSAVSRNTEQIDVFWLEPNGSVASNYWSSKVNKGLWYTAFPIAPPGAATATSGMSVVPRSEHHLDVFWINSRGGISSTWWDEFNAKEVYISWTNPFVESQYRNTYHEFAPDNYELSYTGGQGGHAEAKYLLAKTKVHAVAGFKPSTNGFNFSNSDWKSMNIKLPVVVINFPKPFGKVDISDSTQGLCGGMVYAVIDYYEAKQKLPQTALPPSKETDPLFLYLKSRLESSWDPSGSGANYIKFMRHDYPDADEGVVQGLGLMKGRSFVIARDEWPKIKADIDANKLSPLGLVQTISYNPVDIGKNHQVLCYAYELSASNVTLHIYDPNVPKNDTVRLKFNIGDLAKRIDILRYVDGEYNAKTINTIFRTSYSPPHVSLRRP